MRTVDSIINEKLTEEERIQKHKDFWERKEGSVPLICCESPIEWGYLPFPLANGEVAIDQMNATADMINPEHLLDKNRDGEEVFRTDICGMIPTYRNAWGEAIVGAEYNIGAHSVLGRTNPNKTPDEKFYGFSVEEALNSDFFKLYEKYLRLEVERNPNYPLRQPQVRGILDMLAAYMGETELCYALYDDPEELQRLGNKFVEVHNAIIDKNLEIRPLWHGGRPSYWRIFAPGDCVDYQLDASNIFSPEDYQEHFLPFDRAVLSRYPYSVVHVHMLTGGIHIPSLLTIDELKCIELHMDRECGEYNFETLEKYVKMIQDAGKCVIVYGGFLKEEVQRMIDTFKNEGLCVIYWDPDPSWLEAEKARQA